MSTASRCCALVATAVLALLAAGCTAQQQQARSTPLPPAPAAAPAAPAAHGKAAAFPTGNPQTSVLLVEQIAPSEVLVGQPFEVVYKVSNLTDLLVQDVKLHAHAARNFRGEDASPEPDEMRDGEALWVLGDLPPRESRIIRVRGSALEEGTTSGCVSVSFNPVLCDTIRVVKPAIQLAKSMPAQVIQCDPIPIRLVVRNAGSSPLTNVRVTDSLPNGLATESGQTSVTFDAGTLGPGDSREFTFNALASRTGKFTNPARATSAEGVEASAEASISVVKPALTVACDTPPEMEVAGQRFTQYFGRPFEVCWTIKNPGDAVSANTILEVPVPEGLTYRSATEGGSLSGSTVVWNLGTLAPEATRKVCATFVAANAGNFTFNATTRGACATPASTTCSIRIQGISAILVEVVDDPDPIQVGEETTYTIRITNQGGGLDLKDVVVKAIFPEGLEPGAASHGAQTVGKTVTWPAVSNLQLRQSLVYTVKGRAVRSGDKRLQVEVTTRDRPTPIIEIESTTTY